MQAIASGSITDIGAVDISCRGVLVHSLWSAQIHWDQVLSFRQLGLTLAPVVDFFGAWRALYAWNGPADVFTSLLGAMTARIFFELMPTDSISWKFIGVRSCHLDNWD
jgi:hypothetical protein